MSNDNPSSTPAVYRGATQLISISDLESLQTYFETILKGTSNPSAELGEDGYVPWKLDESGKVDYGQMFPELVSALINHTSMSIKKDGLDFARNISTLNFRGKLVTLNQEEDGQVTISIDESNDLVARFNETTTFSTGAVKITSALRDDMIIPDMTSQYEQGSPLGNWVPGSIQTGLNHDGPDNICYLTLTTAGPVKCSTLTSLFNIDIEDAYGQVRSHLLTTEITSGLTEDAPLGDKTYPYSPNSAIKVFIKGFKEEYEGWSFTPVFRINMAQIFSGSERFRIRIEHLDHNVAYSYISKDMLFNKGTVPTIRGTTITKIDSNTSSEDFITPEYMWCSGVKYVTKGKISVNIGPVNNLNVTAAVADKMKASVNLANDDEIKFTSNDYNLDIDNQSNWVMTFPLKEGIIASTTAECVISAFNAFGVSQEYYTNVPIMANTVRDFEDSTTLKETFKNEDERVTTDFEKWNSQESLVTYDHGAALMVVPTVGVMYPSGDRSSAVPAGSPDYDQASNLRNKKYFCRSFKGNNKVKFGGIFVFEGITQEEFFDPRLAFEISRDRGLNWMSLQHVRNTTAVIPGNNNTSEIVEGVLTHIWERNGKLYVEWSYPSNVSTNIELYFKLRMNETTPFCVKSIQLLNIDGTEDW